MAKKIDPQAKAKKQKVYAAVGGVLLLGLLAFQVPRTMKMLNPPTANPPSSAAAATTPSTTAPVAAPTLSGGNATTAAVSGGDGLTDPDLVPAPQSGQLLAFGLFRTKDPFAQQLGKGAAGSTTNVSVTSVPPKVPAQPAGGSSQGSAPSVKVVPTTAAISVNGESHSVQAGGQFPTSDPIFKLVTLTATTAKVGIAGGTLESGSPTVTLRLRKPVTLLNTADGTRYVLRLLSVS